MLFSSLQFQSSETASETAFDKKYAVCTDNH